MMVEITGSESKGMDPQVIDVVLPTFFTFKVHEPWPLVLLIYPYIL